MPTAISDGSGLQSQNLYILDIQSNFETKVYKLFLGKKKKKKRANAILHMGWKKFNSRGWDLATKHLCWKWSGVLLDNKLNVSLQHSHTLKNANCIIKNTVGCLREFPPPFCSYEEYISGILSSALGCPVHEWYQQAISIRDCNIWEAQEAEFV